MSETDAPRKPDNVIADEVIAGKWGNGQARVTRLRDAGYDPAAVQRIVNQKLAPAPRAPLSPPTEGVDFSVVNGTTAQHLLAAGKRFVCRYVSGGTYKDVVKTEFTGYVAAGVMVVFVWQTTPQRMAAGHQAGRTDADLADQQASSLGAPGVPVYFAADWDATSSEQTAINAYLDGAAEIIGRSRTGVYGSYDVVGRALDTQKATYAWQTYAWSAGRWDPRAHLQQYRNEIRVVGIPTVVDLDRAMYADFGQWPRPRKTNDELADEVIAGRWGNGQERITGLRDAGYDPAAVQKIVDQKMAPLVTVYYTVKTGDTLSSIAAKNGTTWQELARLNNLANPDLIIVGRTLRIR
ncbi:MAG: DUF1906 domain-containing protein [Micrococcales bacterium]|nr:DUF1906 domain-containing protein [Micrococcales bacterium]MCL2667808.1 DUF1906 domain-containing protein [Micrococcales bacterium]